MHPYLTKSAGRFFLIFLSLLFALSFTGALFPAWALVELPIVNYFENTDSAFSGQVIVYATSSDSEKSAASAKKPMDCLFSSTIEADGSVNISITLNSVKKVLKAEVDVEGDIMGMQSLTLDGRPAVFTEEDREQLKMLAQSINPTFDDATRVRERLATFANFVIGKLPAGGVMDIHFIKSATKPSQQCWQFSKFTNVTLIGSDFADKVRNHQLDPWLKARKWVYDESNDAICGLHYTPICDKIGSIYTEKAGFVTTLPLLDPLNPKEIPHVTTYHGNHSPVGVLVKYSADVNNDFCLGRCGPGCYGQLVDYFNSSYYTVSAECFAHDVCIGEVGYDTLIPIGGIGDACLDELLNATWGYVNGLPCNKPSKTDVHDWWMVASEYVLLSKKSTVNGYELQQLQNGTKSTLIPIGSYFLNSNSSKQRMLTVIKLKGADSSFVQWFYTGQLINPTTVEDGLWTNDNKTIASFKAHKVNLNGSVYDVKTQKPISGATIEIKGDNLDTGAQTAKTDKNGKFLFPKVSPHDTYTVTLSKDGYKNLVTTAQVTLDNTPLSYGMGNSSTPSRPENISLSLFAGGTPTTWLFTQYGSTNTVHWTSEMVSYSNVDYWGAHAPYGKVVWSGNSFNYTFKGQSPVSGDSPLIFSGSYDGSKWQSYDISITGTVDAANNLVSAAVTMNAERIYPQTYNQPPTSWASQGNSTHVEYSLSKIPANTPGKYDWMITKSKAPTAVSGVKASYADIYPYDNGNAIFKGVDWTNAGSDTVGTLTLW